MLTTLGIHLLNIMQSFFPMAFIPRGHSMEVSSSSSWYRKVVFMLTILAMNPCGPLSSTVPKTWCHSQPTKVFREADSWNLTVATQYQCSMIHSTELNFKTPNKFYATAIWGHKTLRHLPPYLLFVVIFSSVVIAIGAWSMRKFKFFFAHLAWSTTLFASSFYKICKFLIALTTLGRYSQCSLLLCLHFLSQKVFLFLITFGITN